MIFSVTYRKFLGAIKTDNLTDSGIITFNFHCLALISSYEIPHAVQMSKTLKYFHSIIIDLNVTLKKSSLCIPTTNNKEMVIITKRGWSGGAMVLGKLPVPGHPTNLDYSRARTYCACSGCGWGLFGHFFSRLPFLFSFSLSLGDGPI